MTDSEMKKKLVGRLVESTITHWGFEDRTHKSDGSLIPDGPERVIARWDLRSPLESCRLLGEEAAYGRLRPHADLWSLAILEPTESNLSAIFEAFEVREQHHRSFEFKKKPDGLFYPNQSAAIPAEMHVVLASGRELTGRELRSITDRPTMFQTVFESLPPEQGQFLAEKLIEYFGSQKTEGAGAYKVAGPTPLSRALPALIPLMIRAKPEVGIPWMKENCREASVELLEALDAVGALEEEAAWLLEKEKMRPRNLEDMVRSHADKEWLKGLLQAVFKYLKANPDSMFYRFSNIDRVRNDREQSLEDWDWDTLIISFGGPTELMVSPPASPAPIKAAKRPDWPSMHLNVAIAEARAAAHAGEATDEWDATMAELVAEGQNDDSLTRWASALCNYAEYRLQRKGAPDKALMKELIDAIKLCKPADRQQMIQSALRFISKNPECFELKDIQTVYKAGSKQLRESDTLHPQLYEAFKAVGGLGAVLDFFESSVDKPAQFGTRVPLKVIARAFEDLAAVE